MSDTTATKKSYLTTAFEKVAAKQAANDSDECTMPESNEAAAKRLMKKAGITLAVVTAAVAAAIVIVNKMNTEDETSVEETTED